MTRPILFILCCSFLAGCSYMGMMISHADYFWRQQVSPEQRLYKHMPNHEAFLVSGKIVGARKVNQGAIAVIAVSDKFRNSEVVDVNHSTGPDSHYTVYLPAGEYRLLVVSDLDHNRYYDESEVIGARAVFLTKDSAPDKLLKRYDIRLGAGMNRKRAPFQVTVKTTNPERESLFYPRGSLRTLDDPIFSPRLAALGVYDPGAFLEAAPTMFYAIEEDLFYKVPVIFIHGIQGNVRAFNDIVSALDRTRFKPWFFYYPSGADLNQLSAIFHAIFLSGDVLSLDGTPAVIVAHSMGGLLAREALNRLTGAAGENRVGKLLTIASPMAGMPSARRSATAPVTVQAWRDINPESGFIKSLHRKPIPEGTEYHLMFAYGDSGIRWGDNSDGVVPLASQLSPRAQCEAASQLGFNDTHMGILKNRQTIAEIIRIIGEVRPPYPESHLLELMKGGYNVRMGPHYTPLEKFYIRHAGFYLEALASGKLVPIRPEQQRFVQALRGAKPPRGEIETGWIKFVHEYPDPDRRPLIQYAAGE